MARSAAKFRWLQSYRQMYQAIIQLQKDMATVVDALSMDSEGGLQAIRDNQGTIMQQLNLVKIQVDKLTGEAPDGH